MSEILRVEDVSRNFGGYFALSNVSCRVAQGQIHALIGPNGAGKSTLFNIISGTLAPSGGALFFAGQPYTGRTPDRILRMGIARNFQQVRLVRGLSVLENVLIGRHARMTGGPLGNIGQFIGLGRAEAEARRKSRSVLDLVGMSAKLRAQPDELTLADQRRVEIARALASEPRVLLLDEPAAGMNPTEVLELAALIRQIRNIGVTVVLVEHHMHLVMSIADTVTVLSAGIVLANGPPEAIRNDPDVIAAYLGSGDEPSVHQ